MPGSTAPAWRCIVLVAGGRANRVSMSQGSPDACHRDLCEFVSSDQLEALSWMSHKKTDYIIQ